MSGRQGPHELATRPIISGSGCSTFGPPFRFFPDRWARSAGDPGAAGPAQRSRRERRDVQPVVPMHAHDDIPRADAAVVGVFQLHHPAGRSARGRRVSATQCLQLLGVPVRRGRCSTRAGSRDPCSRRDAERRARTAGGSGYANLTGAAVFPPGRISTSGSSACRSSASRRSPRGSTSSSSILNLRPPG